MATREKIREIMIAVRELRRKLLVSQQTDGRVSLDSCRHTRAICHPVDENCREMLCLDCALVCHIGHGELQFCTTEVSDETFKMCNKYIFADLGKKG